jgi:hypothetical protein
MFSKPTQRFTIPVFVAVALLTGAADLRAQFTFASDNATSSAYSDSWATGDNGGLGFASWTLASGGGTGGFGGNFIGNPNNAGITTFGTNAFAQFANPTGSGAFANADRALSSAMQVGDTFSFQWAINWDSGSGGNKGFNLYTGGVAGTQLINVNNGSSAAITINGVDTTFTFGTSVMTWTFAYTDATTLVVTANDRDGSGTYSNSFTIAEPLMLSASIRRACSPAIRPNLTSTIFCSPITGFTMSRQRKPKRVSSRDRATSQRRVTGR